MANKDIKISEILHLAADEYLWDIVWNHTFIRTTRILDKFELENV